MIRTPKKAIITAAGLSPQFLPMSSVYPREMLPINNKPIIHYVVEEAIKAGVEEICIVVHGDKITKGNDTFSYSVVEQYFEKEIIQEKIKELKKLKFYSEAIILESLLRVCDKIEIRLQEEFKGQANAVLAAEDFIDEDESFFVMFGDVLLDKSTCLEELMAAYKYYKSPVMAVENVQPDEVLNFGMINGTKIEEDMYKLRNIKEKPSVEESPSSLMVMGRYIFESSIFNCMSNLEDGSTLVDVINSFMENDSKFSKNDFYARRYRGDSYNIWNEIQYLKACFNINISENQLNKFIEENIVKNNSSDFIEDINPNYKRIITQYLTKLALKERENRL